jgi:hypothetical protein
MPPCLVIYLPGTNCILNHNLAYATKWGSYQKLSIDWMNRSRYQKTILADLLLSETQLNHRPSFLDARRPSRAWIPLYPEAGLLQATNTWHATEGFVEGNDLASAGLKGNLGNQVIGKSGRTFAGSLQSSPSKRG